ncbi:MAG TPA: ATPase [Armatimonadetes bacterium]|nr:ATPase [Armatimonadota bacterium]
MRSVTGLDVARQIEVLIRARYSVIYIVSWEEERVEQTLRAVGEKLDKNVFTWTVTQGMLHADGRGSGASTGSAVQGLEFALAQQDPAIFIMRDFDTTLNDPIVERKLRDVAKAFRSSYKTLVILSPVLTIPPHLEKEITVIDYPLPDEAALGELLDALIAQLRDHPTIHVDLTDETREGILKAALGLTATEAEDAFAKAVILNGKLDRDDIGLIVSEKQQVIRKSGILEYYEAEEQIATVGGLGALKEWLQKRGKAFSEKARAFGLPEPRGVLLIGVQGCGKSLSAKAVSGLWHLPLLRLDLGSVFSGIVGSSEMNMRRAMRLAESVSPCILWLDELEKGFSGTRSSDFSDAGVAARVFGSFITWLQEKTQPVFVIATANNISALPPELMRKGRFDEIFFIDLPRQDEREEIFRIHIARRERDPERYNLRALAEEAEGFSGSEIEQVVISALYDAFDRAGELSQEDLMANIGNTVPLSQTRAEEIEALRDWARDRARPASP